MLEVIRDLWARRNQDVCARICILERAGLNGLNEGQKISYELQTERGRDAAVNLKA